MDCIEDRQRSNELGRHHRDGPRDAATKIVSDDVCVRVSMARDETGDVTDEALDGVCAHADGLVGFCIAAHVGCDDEVPRRRDRRKLRSPRLRTRREPVNEHDDWMRRIACDCAIEMHPNQSVELVTDSIVG